MFVGIMTHTVYGTSGNELPPAAVNRVKTAQLIDAETIEEAYGIMVDNVMPLRLAAAKRFLNDKNSYSSADGYDWEVIKMT